MDLLPCCDAPDAQQLKEVMPWSASMLVVLAAGSSAKLHSQANVRELEARSPFRFGILEKQSRRLASRRISLMRMIEAFAVAPVAGEGD